MPFTAHLAELRSRILWTLIGVTVGTLLSYFWVEELFALLTEPIRDSFGKLELIGTGPTEAFMCKLRVAVGAGVVLSTPYTFYQLWLFISPGLLDKEKRFALPFVISSTVFFLLGVIFCFKAVLPLAFHFFSDEFISINVSPAIRIGEYFEFVVKMTLVFGFVFELPLVCYFLSRFGILKHAFLKKYVRHFILGIFIAAGLFSPPDVISQMLLAGPLLIIYGLCLGITLAVEKQKKKKAGGTKDPDQEASSGNSIIP